MMPSTRSNRSSRLLTEALTAPSLLLLALFSIFLLCSAPVSVAQSSLGNSQASLSQNANPFNSSDPSSFGLTNNPVEEFLPVEEAYQLSTQLNLNSNANPNKRELLLSWQIAPAYYLYQHSIKVTWQGSPLTLDLPPAQSKYDELFEKDVGAYYKQLRVTATLPDGLTFPTQVQVYSQGCADAGLCYPPQINTIELSADGSSFPLESDSNPSAANADANSTEAAGNITQTQTTSSAWFISWLGALLAALLGGLILNLMPCVFPVLSLKALSLAQGQHDAVTQRKHGWSYTAGTVITFVVIALIMLILRHSGQAIGWGFQLQNPVFVALLVYLFVVMALSLMGFVQLSNRYAGAGQALTQGHSYRASFFTGALATLVASPCTAPFMASALGYAAAQPAVVALSVFAVLGLGMALPYLLLSYSPLLAKRLPKPGPWMETLKQLLSFPLLLTALWLAWVLGRQTGLNGLIGLLAGTIALVFALWLWQHQPQRAWQKVMALVALIVALWPVAQLTDNTVVPAEATDAQAGSTTSQTSTTPVLSHGWQPYTAERLEQLLKQGTPVFVNLTADWCITCLANEKIALNTQATLTAFEQAGVVRLKGDWTHYDPNITRYLAEFGRNGVPLYLLYTGQANQPPRILPQLLRPDTVIEALESLKNSP